MDATFPFDYYYLRVPKIRHGKHIGAFSAARGGKWVIIWRIFSSCLLALLFVIYYYFFFLLLLFLLFFIIITSFSFTDEVLFLSLGDGVGPPGEVGRPVLVRGYPIPFGVTRLVGLFTC